MIKADKSTQNSFSISSTLEDDILSGKYADGERLDELKLAAAFKVSRTPIREAFSRLISTGLVEQLPNRGTFVRLPGPVALLELFELMAELEASCARLAAMRISDDAITALEAANQDCLQAIESSSSDDYYKHNERFHRIIYQQSQNSALAAEAIKLHTRLKPYRRIQLRARGRMAQSMSEHEAIVKALAAGNAEEAATVMREHVAIQGEKFNTLLRLAPDSLAIGK